MRWLTLILAGHGACAIAAQAFPIIDPRDSADLGMIIERVEDGVDVDGVPMQIWRAHGGAVATLADRMTQRWQAEGSEIRSATHGEWQMRSRWRGRHMDLLQWRGDGTKAELMLSSLDARMSRGDAAAPPFILPGACAWGRKVRGRSADSRYEQRSAFCRLPATEASSIFAAALTASGWSRRGVGNHALDMHRNGVDARLVIVPATRPSGCWLIWVQTSGNHP